MKVLVTGANGMLGQDLCPMLEEAGHTPVRTDVGVKEGAAAPAWEAMDITSPQVVREVFERTRPEAVIHAAAYTDVDGCERSPDLAYKINAMGTWSMAAACAEFDVPIYYISTDFVFDGEKSEPYTEFDAVNPLSHYGASKLAGEQMVARLCRKHFIVRTQWLNGVHGRSFVSIMLELARTRSEWKVVVDQIGSPTFTRDLSAMLIRLLPSRLYGTYHVSNRGACSWHELAAAALQMSGITHITLHPIPASQWPSPTRRPAHSVLRRYALELQGMDDMRPWQEALQDFLQQQKTLTANL